jgi:hypothetical protein
MPGSGLARTLTFTAIAALSGCSPGAGTRRLGLVGHDLACDTDTQRAVAPGDSVTLDVALAPGVAFPRRGRIAFVVSTPLPYHRDPEQRLHLFEYATTALPDALPARVTLPLPPPPADLLALVRQRAADPGPNGPVGAPPRLDTRLVVYDDADGNGHMTVAASSPRHAPAPGQAAGSGAAEILTWSGELGGGNELAALTYLDAPYDDATARYTVSLVDVACTRPDDDGQSCCVSQLGAPSAGDAYPLTLGWSAGPSTP